MAKTVSLKPLEDSADKPNSKPLPGDKSIGIDPDTLFYEIEDSDNTEEVEESEILVITTQA